jgi:hypothetical protein
LICPDQFSIGTRAINILQGREEPKLKKWHDNVLLWPSFFSGLEVISNRITPPHCDAQAGASDYDFLVSAGRHKEAWLELPDINTRLSYKPCTVVAICGKVLCHAMPSWDGGERLCIAHFIRDNVHMRLELPRPDWVNNGQYLRMMEGGFLARQGLS